jgi:glutamate synthase domain-containing protein 1
MKGLPPPQGLYDPQFEHDACGVGFICHMKGQASHQIVVDALQMLSNMNHRGGCGCEEDSGDGAGILVRMPDEFLRTKAADLGITLPPAGSYAVGQVFFPQGRGALEEAKRAFEKVIREYGMVVLGWRDVPTDDRFTGPTPRRSCRRSCRSSSAWARRSTTGPTSSGGCTSSASGPRT